MKPGKTMEELVIGEEASFSKTITEVDIAMFAAFTGDFNSMHMDEVYTSRTRFGRRIAHGGVAAALAPTILDNSLPGLGTLVQEMRYKYLAPVYPGDTITCTGKLIEKDVEQNLATVQFTFTNQDSSGVIIGWAKVIPPKKSA
ncbi:MAG: MaoC family dehydratase [Firmicutes bacterium]|nr:MaoC family dehydratase [Bacillota bacterium]